MEPTLKGIIENVKKMVDSGILTLDYEVQADSYICFIFKNPAGGNMYYTGKMSTFPVEIQESFLGLYLNDTEGPYKITGIYKIMDELK